MGSLKTKKKKVSKKTKKSWRKHVDTTDVDKFLEESQLEERLGSFATRKDSELFTISTAPAVLSKTKRRELIKSKEPRCFNVLKPHTAVPDPIAKRNRVRTKDERKNKLVLKKEALRRSQGILKLKEKLGQKNRLLAARKRLSKPKRGEVNSDAWEGIAAKDVNADWMSPDTLRYTMTHFGVKKRRIPVSLRKKTSVIPAIEAPHPGTSYNPSYDDHQDLLQEVAQKEMELIKEEKHLDRVTTKMFKKISPEEKEKNLIKELTEGLNTKVERNEDDDDDGDPTVKSVNPPVRNLKKTRVQRRKQKEQRVLALKMKHQKLEKKKLSDIYKLKHLGRQLIAKDKEEDVSKEKRLKKKAQKAMGTKTLSKVKFEPAEHDFKMAQELTGNLRNSEPTGNLLKDRFISLQQRNIVAPANIRLKRDKAKVKRFTKPDHRIDEPKAK